MITSRMWNSCAVYGLRCFLNYKFRKREISMTKYFDAIYFKKEKKVKIGNINYIVNSYFDENSETLIDKIKNLLVLEIKKT